MRRIAIMLVLLASAAAAEDGQRFRLCDKSSATNCATVNSSGQVSISGTISASTTGRATAAAPTYVEGTDNPLSIDLSGNIRTLATAQTAAKATAAVPSYVEGSTSPLSQDLSGHLRVDGHDYTQPISAASLPLPTGASTEATLALIKAKTDNLDVLLSTRTKPADTQAVSAASLPLPAGAATEATLALIKTDVDKIPTSPATDRTTAAGPFAVRISDGAAFLDPRDVSDRAARLLGVLSTGANTIGAVNQSGTWTVQPGNTANTTAWKVDASSVTVPISAVSLPLPVGASSDATVAETHAVSLGSIPTRQDMIAGSDYGYTCNNGACSQIPRVDANGVIYTAPTNIVRVQVVSSVNSLLQRCNPVRRINCQP